MFSSPNWAVTTFEACQEECPPSSAFLGISFNEEYELCFCLYDYDSLPPAPEGFKVRIEDGTGPIAYANGDEHGFSCYKYHPAQ